jgi:hypothetical protein
MTSRIAVGATKRQSPGEIFAQELGQSVGAVPRRHEPQILAAPAHQIDGAGMIDRIFAAAFARHLRGADVARSPI